MLLAFKMEEGSMRQGMGKQGGRFFLRAPGPTLYCQVREAGVDPGEGSRSVWSACHVPGIV